MFSMILAFMACWKPESWAVEFSSAKGLLLLLALTAALKAGEPGRAWLAPGRKMTLLLALLAMACMASR